MVLYTSKAGKRVEVMLSVPTMGGKETQENLRGVRFSHYLDYDDGILGVSIFPNLAYWTHQICADLCKSVTSSFLYTC
jgi:hypothetical protein